VEYSDAAMYDNLRKEEQLRKSRIIFHELGDKETLDVGCGTGISSSLFSNIIGIDPSDELLSLNPYPHIKGNAESLPFKDSEFENVIAVTSMHNFHDIEKALKEIKRVGKRFGFSILKNSSVFPFMKQKIQELFIIEKEIDEGIDMIFICAKTQPPHPPRQ
jgi:ubiquinone/menaquinone biosynthesis C-methylase UbiE